jgi:predicted Fe-Mo cluster-binding NifX family protein
MKKRLAIPTDSGVLSQHFGHAPLFVFFDIEDNKIIKEQHLPPPPHTEGSIPRWLADQATTDILTGGIGPKAVEILYAKGINVYVGVEIDEPANLAMDFVNGDLKFGKNYCHH